jgi:hypothetical protein
LLIKDDSVQFIKLLLALASTVVLGFGTHNLIYVHPKIIVYVFGNEVFSSVRGGVCFPE